MRGKEVELAPLRKVTVLPMGACDVEVTFGW